MNYELFQALLSWVEREGYHVTEAGYNPTWSFKPIRISCNKDGKKLVIGVEEEVPVNE